MKSRRRSSQVLESGSRLAKRLTRREPFDYVKQASGVSDEMDAPTTIDRGQMSDLLLDRGQVHARRYVSGCVSDVPPLVSIEIAE